MKFRLLLRKILTTVITAVVVGYAILPVLLTYSPHVADFFVFLNHVALPFTRNFSDLAHFGLSHVHATAHFIDTTDGVKLGAWLIRPPDGVVSRNQAILYLHGNSGTRGTPHRIALYRVLANAGFDVVTFDYRGYADSGCSHLPTENDCEPSEKGLITDGLTMYKWTLNSIKHRWNGDEESIVLWGHSLGGGAATNLAHTLCPEVSHNCEAVRALILEATFSDITEAAVSYPLAWPLRIYPPALEVLTHAILSRGIHFNNTNVLSKVRLPVLMMHAADDWVVPASLSQRAFAVADAVRPDEWPPIEYKLFGSEFGYGHRSLHDAPELVPYVIDFIKK